VSNAQYTTYNATPLYEIWSNVVAAENKTLAGAQIVFAQLTAANATAGSDNNTSGGPGIPPPAPKHAAMLVLYVITGIVCGLFSLIIVSGVRPDYMRGLHSLTPCVHYVVRPRDAQPRPLRPALRWTRRR
jgi:hypothetical protein